MVNASYQNYYHYLDKNKATEPKRTFVRLNDLMNDMTLPSDAKVLDVGCACGELIEFLHGEYSKFDYHGVDIFPELITQASDACPYAKFSVENAMDLPKNHKASFDLSVAMGVMSVFKEDKLTTFWKNMLDITKPGGYIVVFAGLNENGVDTLIDHRVWQNNKPKAWETGWNIYSFNTIKSVLAELGQEVEFHRFQIDIPLQPKSDPVRTWTIKTETSDFQLINGLKLMINHYYMVVKKA